MLDKSRRTEREPSPAGCDALGGFCHPKAVKALAAMARDDGLDLNLLNAALGIKQRVRRRSVDETVHTLHGLSGATVAVHGLAFRPNTDDIRDAPVLTVIG